VKAKKESRKVSKAADRRKPLGFSLKSRAEEKDATDSAL